MKTKFTKRMLSVFLALLMVITSVPVSMFTAFADDETIVWKFDPSQTSATGNGSTFTKGSAYKIVDPSNKSSFIQGIFWNDTDKNCNTDGSTYFHAEDASISGGIGSTTGFGSQKLYGNHWIFQYRYAYLAQGKNGDGNNVTDNNNTSVFALGNDGANVVNITSDGNVYINGSATPTAQIDRNKIICNDKADVRTAAFEFENGTLTFSIKGETLFTTTAINGTPDITNFFMGASKVTTAGGTMQYVGPANTGNLIHGMYLYKLIGSVITPSESTAIIKSGTLNQNGYTIITGSGSRLDGSNWNIVNDQEQGNTSAGIVKFDISELKGRIAKDSTLNVQVAAFGDDYQGLTFYWTTDTDKVNATGGLNNGQQQGKITGSGNYGSGTNANVKVANTLGFNVDNNKVCSLPKSSKDGGAGEKTIDVSAATLQKIIDSGSNVVYLVCMMSQAGGKGGAPWSDTKVVPTSIKLNYVYEIPDATKEEVETAFNAVPKSPTVKQGNTNESKDGTINNNLTGGDVVSNVLYMGGLANGSTFKETSDNNYFTCGVQFGDITFLDDGESTMGAPISCFFNNKKAGFPTYSNRDTKPISAKVTTEPFYLAHRWHGEENKNAGYFAGTGYTLNYGQLNDNYSTSGITQAVFKDNRSFRYSNTLYVDRSLIKYNDNYRFTNNSQQFYLYANSDSGNREREVTLNNSIRIINYAPLAEIIRGIKNSTLQEYKNIKDSYEHNYYTGSSTVNYLKALKEVCDFDPNTYFSKDKNGYSDCCDEIARLVKLYNDAKEDLKLNTYNVKFVYNDGHTLEKKVKRFGTVTCPNDGSPEVITTHKEDAHPNTHKVTRYYWGPADLSIVKDMEYHELSAVSYIEHTWVQGETVAPTCDDEGYTVYECSVCHDSKHDDLVDATGHTYRPNQGSAVAPYNYTNGETYDAEKDYKHAIDCIISRDHTKKIESCDIGASWVVNGDTETSTCSTCGGYVTRPHIVGYDIVFKDKDGNVIATNTTMEGVMPSTPNLLNYAYIDEEGHHSFSWNKEIVEATGATEYQMVENELVPHAYADNYTQITASTCYAEGLEADQCTVARDCTYSKTRPIEKIAHTWGDWEYDSVQRRQYHTCTVPECQKTEYADCTFEITTNEPATCTAEGRIVYTCTSCGGSYTEYPEALGHNLSDTWKPNNNGAHYKECSRCDYTSSESCTLESTTVPATCTQNAYFTSKCSVCGYETSKVDAINDFEGYDLKDLTNSTLVEKASSTNDTHHKKVPTSDYRYVDIWGQFETRTFEYNLPFECEKVTFRMYSHTYSGSGDSWLRVKDDDNNEALYRIANSYKDNDYITLNDTSKIVFDTYFHHPHDIIVITDVKVWPKEYKAKGHSYVKSNDFGNGLLGTHTCSVCHETTEHDLALNRSGNNIVVSCTSCDFSEVLHTTANTVTVTENNMFDTDKFFSTFESQTNTNATANNRGYFCVRRTDGKLVVVGNGDNYTPDSKTKDYSVTVEGGKTYQFDVDASTKYGDIMLFYLNDAGTGYDGNYLNMRKTGTTVGTNTIEFTVPEGANRKLFIRVGTNDINPDNGKNVYCVFSNFALHEKDDPNYRMIKDVPMDSSIDSYLTGSGTEALCHYEFNNSSISFTDGTIANGKTVNRNVNVVKSTQHDIYKEFSNGTVAHFYCVTCGYNYDKETSLNMVYRESFDDASVSGSTFTSSNGNATLKNSGTGSIVEYAGIKDKGPRSTNVRHNVLKLNANNTKPGNWMKLDTNPLADPAVAEKAKQDGITISFWRHMEKNGAAANLEGSGDPTGYPWRNALSFEQDGNAGNRYYIEVNGVQSRCAVEGQDYTDLVPYYNDNTTKGTPNYTGDWVNIVVTIDPTDKVNGGTLYINGVPREYDLTRTKGAGKYVLSDTMNPGDIAADVLNFLTQSNTGFYFNNGDPWEGNDFDMFYDDVRIYTGVMTQLQINEMYGAPDSDTPSTNSITHDPTNVTVYTLKAGTYTAVNGSGDTYVAEAGKTVGEEFINYYGVDVASQVSNIEYYSFGTGMVVEKSSNGVDWTLVGDSKGHFAYQNEDLFGGKYTDVLSEPLNYAKQGASGGGYLLWAPHVMYNLTLNKWVIYESTSSWGSQFSTIFYCTSDTVYKDYAYQGMIHKTNSSSKCNAIDSDVYYGRDENGIIDKDTLYLAYGSYIWNGSQHAIWGRTLTATGENRPGVDSVWSESVDYPLVKADGTSSEGIYVYYVDGYYYMFTTYGSNDYNYTEVYFRSENPNGPFTRYDGVLSTDNIGMYFMSSYHNPVEPYTYWANGHNSVYTVYNNAGEPMLINAAHSRVLTDGVPQSEEGQIITNQTDIRGNLMISNMLAQTKSGWMVMFPLQYNGTDTTKLHLTANDVVGTYDVTLNIKGTSNGVSETHPVTISACDDTHIYMDGTMFALEYDEDKDITYLVGETLEGAFAKHNDTIEFSLFNKNTLQHVWGYQTEKGTAGHVEPLVGDNNAVAPTCTTTGLTESKHCSRCNRTVVEQEVIDATGHSFSIVGDKIVCANDAEHNIDISAYNAAVASARAEIANTAKYTEVSRNALAAKITKFDLTKSRDEIVADVETATTDITTANKVKDGENGGVLVLESYTLKFFTVDDNTNNPVRVDIGQETYTYGSVVVLSTSGLDVALPHKWVKSIENKEDRQVADSTDQLTVVVNDNIDIYAYYGTKEVVTTQSIVTVYNRINKVVDYIYANNGDEVTFEGSTINIGAQSVTVPKTPFYQIDGFMADGKLISDGYVIDGNVSLVPVYRAQNEIVITLGTDNISFVDTAERSKIALWDHKVTVTANSEVTWYVDDIAVAKGTSYTFRASNSVTIKAEADIAETGSTTITFSDFDTSTRKAKYVVSSYSSSTKRIAEQGLIVASSKNAGVTLDQSTLAIKGKKFIATKTTDQGNQFSYSIDFSASTATKTIVAMSYVIYEGDSTVYYSDVVNLQI